MERTACRRPTASKCTVRTASSGKRLSFYLCVTQYADTGDRVIATLQTSDTLIVTLEKVRLSCHMFCRLARRDCVTTALRIENVVR
jgi:hypothetical protein